MLTALRIIDEGVNLKQKTLLSDYLPAYESICTMATGRSAIAHLICTIGFSGKDSVLLPAYVPEGVIKPFIEAGIPIIFYRLDNNQFPDVLDISRIIEKEDTITLCILIHPMGFEIPMHPLTQLLGVKQILILEDCAQGIFSCYGQDNSPFGSRGDFALYSMNKFIPVLDGAILISHVERYDISFDEEKVLPLEAAALESYKRHLEINRELFLTKDSDQASLLIQQSSIEYELYYSFIEKHLKQARISDFSKKIINSYNFGSLIRRRKENTQIVYDKFKPGRIDLLHKEYSENIIPMAIPVLIHDKKRDAIMTQLCRKGILLAKQVERWDFISMTNRAALFANEVHYMNNHALVPINEFIDQDHIFYLIDQLNSLSVQ